MEEMDPIFAHLHKSGVVAVVTIDDPEQAVPLARALIAGGIDAMELTLRSEAAIPGIRRIVAGVLEMRVGAGTVLHEGQVEEAKRAGAAFAVAPGTNPRVIEAARELNLSFAPGIATPSDIEAALELDCRLLKFFPADGMGGLPYLQNIAAPYRHLGLRYLPLGGINATNMCDYLACPDVLAVGGSWLAPQPMIAARDWSGIEALATQASGLISKTRTGS